MNKKDFSDHFRELVQKQLPDNARILMPRDGADLIILVSWRLGSDPSRPSKRSRMIRVVISEEAIDDYAAGSDGIRLASDSRFETFLQKQLDAFDPDHDAPLGVEPKSVTWLIDTLALNG